MTAYFYVGCLTMIKLKQYGNKISQNKIKLTSTNFSRLLLLPERDVLC